MKRIVCILSVSLLILSSCSNGLKNDKTETGQITDKTEMIKDSVNKPESRIKVNKEYDEDGNLVKYDSAYMLFYSNIEKNKPLADSVFNNFKQYFFDQYPFSKRLYFNDLFFNDSLLMYDFYKKDFFGNRFNMNQDMMKDMFRELDSVKNEFYKKYDGL